jgi:choline dehydrogenase-like flavoprotein
MDRELSVAPTPRELWGGTGEALHRALPSTPIRRNAPGCTASGRCLQGCPHRGEGGPIGKLSADVGLLPRAARDGAKIVARCRVRRALTENGRAAGVVGRFEGGARFRARAPLVVLAASAIETPLLLRRSGLEGVGRGFQCHPGASMAGLFPDALAPGATQAMESLAFRDRGFKLETLSLAGAFRHARIPGFGPALARRILDADRVATWGVACRAEARGRLLPGPLVLFSPSRRDRQVILEGLALAATAMLRAGALEVWPAVFGAPEVIRTEAEARRLAEVNPAPGVVPLLATHFFCGVDVGERFQVAGVRGLVVADSSLFPTNLGVNPMSAITAVATLVAEAWAS